MKLRDITDAIGGDNKPTLRRAFRSLVSFPREEEIEASSPGLLIVALNRICEALKKDEAEMPAAICGALDLAPCSTYAEGVAKAKQDSARFARHLMAIDAR